MDRNIDDLEFDVLGFKIRYKPDEGNRLISAVDIIDLVNHETGKMKSKFPQLENGEVIVLSILKMAEDLLAIKKEYRETVDRFQGAAVEALDSMENVDRPLA